MKKKVFENGLRALVDSCPWSHSVALVVIIEGGLSDESEKQVGISHVLEHLLFKRTKQNGTREIAVRMDELGGEINAYTEVNSISFYGVVPASRLSDLLAFFAELLNESAFHDDDVELEKEIIRQEILEANDGPAEVTYQALCQLLWPGTIFRYPVFGTLEAVERLRLNEMKERLATIMAGGRMIVAAAGNVEAEKFFDEVHKHFSRVPAGKWQRPKVPDTSSGVVLIPHPVTQVHLALTQQFPSIGEDDYLESLVFAGIIGDGLSSRLFQLLREELGMAYDVSAYVESVSDRSLFFTSVVLERENVDETLALILSELNKVRSEPISAAELARMKSYVSAQLEMELDSLSGRLFRMVEGEMYLGRYVGADEVLGKIQKLTIDDISRFVERRLSFRNSALALGGNVERLELSGEIKAFCGMAN